MKDLLLQDPVIWLVFSFVIFMVAAFVFGRKSATDVLDVEIAKIRAQISAAEQLKSDAAALVAQYKSNLENAHSEADKIIASAKKQADDIRKSGETELAESMARREAMLKNRIEQLERGAMDDIRRYAAELAVSATSEIIAQKLTPQNAQNLTDNSISNIAERLN